jgi:hypothetical protein
MIDWNIFDLTTTYLARFDIFYDKDKTNDSTHTTQSLDAFLVESPGHILDSTNTRHVEIKDYSYGKVLKINRRSNPLFFRVY